MIDPLTRDKIIEAAQVVDVIRDFVTLKKRGINYIGLCPFHNEKTPSFTVSPSKGIFKCFGCGKGGNAVSFIIEHEQLSYPEALKFLAKKYGIQVEERELSEEEKKIGSERESLMIVTAFASRYFSNALHNTNEGNEIGLSYFRERGFNRETINEFMLGYSPDQKDSLTEEALKNGYKIEFLEKTGLSIVKENYKADRFAGRVIFPIFSLSGKVIGFGGRTLKDDKKIAKYLNSPESLIYNKSKVLYGLFQAKKDIVRENKCFLVEGYTDVLSFYESGIKNVVASSGTSLTEDQIRLIKRFTENVTILFDGDPAGIKASLRSIDMILEMDMNVRVVLFPEGEDPDSFAKKHSSSELISFIKDNEEDFIRFKIKLLKKDFENDPLKRASLISDIVRSIAQINDNIKQAIYVQECSELLEIEESVIYSEIRKIKRKKFEEESKRILNERKAAPQHQTPSLPAFVDKIYYEVQEKEIIRLILLYGNHQMGNYENSNREVNVAEYIINELRNDNLKINNLVYDKIFTIVEELVSKGEPIDYKFFVNHQDLEVSKISADLCSVNYTLSNIWKKRGTPLPPEESQLNNILQDVIIKYKLKVSQLARAEILKEIKKVKSPGEELNLLLQRQQELSKIIQKLSDLQGRVIL